MFIGIDVKHPSEQEQLASSVVVALGSLDHLFSSYTPSIRVQQRATENIIRFLETMIQELLQEYYKANQRYPENLIIFRDGVSDGQIQAVCQAEIRQIHTAINRTGQPIKFTIIITQKHHNTRK